MKISKSLVGTDIGKAIFKKSIDDFSTFLENTFNLMKGDPADCEFFNVNESEYTAATKFNYNNRAIHVFFSYEIAQNDVMQEVITIKEMNELERQVKGDSFEDAINNLHAVIFEIYDVDFVPLDPADFTSYVLMVDENPDDKTYKAVFKSPLFAGIVEMEYDMNSENVKFVSCVSHKIIMN